MKVESEVAYVDGQKVILDEPPTINPKTERTLIPLRFLSEALGFNIHWNGVNKTIRITKR